LFSLATLRALRTEIVAAASETPPEMRATTIAVDIAHRR
jgi:hypothetical protein